ncbi:MAG: ComF family protein [Chloroflexi bacterium]|nr:ComF family protein [Chloroflexota bacterium]
MIRQRWLQAIVDFLYPFRCLSCGRLGTPFCRRCRAQAQPVGELICIRCGQPTTIRCICSFCRQSPPDPLQGIRGAVFYGSPISFAIHGLKYGGMTQLAAPLATYLLDHLDTHPLPFDFLIPVPLHAQRLAHRGYNQSALLAAQVGARRGIAVRSDVIYRTRHTPPQVQLSRQQRLQNMEQAFAATQPHMLAGERILLIDDVCTTGATLRACATALKETGAGEIWALTVARARAPLDPEPWQNGLRPDQVFLAWDAMQQQAPTSL